ncbi:MAG: galactose-1-phosphate uridylyltransferase [Deltaproteobacteria bacterium]|nr:galactose-1-phosphate uridylyltransferase [Deltaproteobacteria bacterium]MBW2120397.1 galactose-1-phosphate uridylyltransferase [Deltaproteobacteria bacterium]
MKDGEIRQNKATKHWVIYAPSRGGRPRQLERPADRERSVTVVGEGCPFCPGNEHMLPPIIMEMPGQGAQSWRTRVVPNKFPALTPLGDTRRSARGIYLVMPGHGRHEVIVEGPYHNRDISEMTGEDADAVIETYHRRYVDLMKEHENMMAIIFRNHGVLAGTSLIHPHSQIIVTPMVPSYIRWREEQAERYFDEFGRCVYCDILEFEMKDQRRVTLENRSFLAFVPFAAEVPFEIWIMPKRHHGDFGSISDEEKEDLSSVLVGSLAGLRQKLHDPDYNYIINTSARFEADAPHLHWYLQIRPRLTTQAGFEIGSGISINPSLPEENAEFLRA